tara:strand:- start:139 stop:324 length:186 start_codon:yes stop_codon:yes gene_type:complete
MVVLSERYLLVQCELFGEARVEPTVSVLHGCLRDAILAHFGDFGLGSVLSTLQGERDDAVR